MHEVITNNLDLWSSALLAKSTAGRGTNGKQEAYGIKKLRELILELAVRGKLVPQDPNDAPASVLLGEIAKEKTRLIKEGILKNEKSLPDIGDDEKPYELPQGWQWARFGTIAQHNSGKTLDSGRNTGQLRDYITTSNLYWGRFDLENIRQMPIADDELDKCTAKKGDLLICEGGEAGRAAVWPYDHDVCFQNHVHRARFYGEIDPSFVYRALEKLNATGEIDQHRKGVGISNMSSKALALIVLPLPPLAEQHRIVAKVDELMALCDQLEQQQTHSIDAHQTLVETVLGTLTRVSSQQELGEVWTRIANHFDTLFTTEHSIDQLKQTILQLAVMGKLVPQDPNEEPTSALLKKIAAEKARLAKEGKIKKEEPFPEIAEDEKPFVLPEGWQWSRFGDLWLDSFYGPRFGKDEYVTHGGYPTIRTTDMTADGKINLKDPPEVIVDESKLSLYGLEMGDLLITRSGSIGTMAIYDLDMVAIPSAYLIRVRLLKPMLPEYTLMMLMSPLGQSYLGLNTTSVGVPNVNATKMSKFVFAIPPETEQQRIVAEVKKLVTLCDALKSQLRYAQATQIHLADVIVEQAVA